MKQFKVMAAVAVAGLMMLASCSKEGDNGLSGNAGAKAVKIQISYDRGESRAEGAKVADETSLTMSAGHIFFATSTGLIEKHVGIENTAGSGSGIGSVQVTLADLTGEEAVIEGVPGTATKCYIVSNDVNAGVTISGNLEGQNISSVLAKVIAVNDLNDAAGAVTNVPLYGVGDVTGAGGQTEGEEIPYDVSVEVEMNALAARYQIGKISAKVYNYTDGTDNYTVTVDAFTVEGIYINNFNEDMTIGSTLGTLVDNENVPANYLASASVYKAGGSGEKLNDQLAQAAANSPLAVALADDKVWAYNLFPGATVPHIVIKLSEVKFTDSKTREQTILANQFLTIKTFKTSGVGGSEVTSLAANNIYTFSDIQFDYTKLSAVPEAEDVDVLVTVKMMQWLDNEVEWTN